MIDWHSHVLPCMDDGSHSTEESIALLQMQAAQGVATVVATPHFYANDESVASFSNRREKSFAALQAAYPDNPLRMVLGAEVKYYPGISRLDGLKSLRIGGTKLLLLEMSMTKWPESTVQELIELSGGTTQIVLAHVERYYAFQSSAVWKRLYECGILMQCNASFFFSRMTKRKALAMLRQDRVQFIGSDCHNTASRPPRLDEAYEVIAKKCGDDYLKQMDQYWHSLLQ